MPQVITVTSRKYFNQLKNGTNFNLNTGDFATHLLGCVAERLRYDVEFAVSWNSIATNIYPFTSSDVIPGSVYRITRNSGSFIQDGLRINDTVDVIGTTGTFTTDGVLIYVTDLEIHVQGAFSGSHGEFIGMNILGKTPLESIKYFYGLIENGESTNYQSKIDNNDQFFYGENINTLTTLISGGAFKSWIFNDRVEAEKTGTSINGYIQYFKVSHEFNVVPFYLDGQQQNLISKIPPQPYAGNGALKHVVKFELNSAITNPNTAHEFVDDILLGETGWFEERFNGLQNDEYRIDNVTYEDAVTTASADGLLIGNQTAVNFDLISDSGLFIDEETPAAVCVFKLASISDYQGSGNGTTTTTGKENFMLEICRALNDNNAESIGIISELRIEFINANQLKIRAVVDLTNISGLNINDMFAISAIIEDSQKAAQDSDRVNLLVDVANFDNYPDIPGLLTWQDKQVSIYTSSRGTTMGYTCYKGPVQDTILLEVYPIIKYDIHPTVIERVYASFTAVNIATGQTIVLDGFEFNLNNVITVGVIPQINIVQPRNFNMEINHDFRNASIEMGGGTIGVEQEYTVKIPLKIRYEEYLPNNTVPTIFFNPSQQNNGLNFLSSNYFNQNGFTLQFSLTLELGNGAGVTTNYVGTCILGNEVYDFFEDGNIPPDWSVEMKTYSFATGNDLGGAILFNEQTLVEAVFTPSSGSIPFTNVINGVIRIEELNAGMSNIEEIDILYNRIPGSKLIPLPGETGSRVEVTSTEIKVSCLVDHTRLDPNKTYTLYSTFAELP